MKKRNENAKKIPRQRIIQAQVQVDEFREPIHAFSRRREDDLLVIFRSFLREVAGVIFTHKHSPQGQNPKSGG
jgi:hypothetical protein